MTQTRTSQSHPLQIPDLIVKNGKFGITFCPGKKQATSLSGGQWDRDLDTDVAAIKRWGASLVIGCPELHELISLGVEKLTQAMVRESISFIPLPIKDDDIPTKETDIIIRSIIPLVNDIISRGGNILFFCKGGLGHSGLVFAVMYKTIMNVSGEVAIERLRAIRPGAICTKEQEAYVIAF